MTLPIPSTLEREKEKAQVEAAAMAICEAMFDMSEPVGSKAFVTAKLSADKMLRKKCRIAARAALKAVAALEREKEKL